MSSDAGVLVDILWSDPKMRFVLAGGTTVAALVAVPVLRKSRLRALWTFLALTGLTVIVASTLFGARGGVQYLDVARLRWCLDGGGGGWALGGEAMLNTVLFMPAAFFGTLAVGRPIVVAPAIVAGTALIELLQGSTGIGTCQVADAVRNGAGGLVAVIVAVGVMHGRHWLHPVCRRGRLEP